MSEINPSTCVLVCMRVIPFSENYLLTQGNLWEKVAGLSFPRRAGCISEPRVFSMGRGHSIPQVLRPQPTGVIRKSSLSHPHVRSCGRLNKGSPKMSTGTCEYVTFYDKRDFANVSKLTILRWGDYPGLFKWAQSHHRKAGRSKSEKGDVRTWTLPQW